MNEADRRLVLAMIERRTKALAAEYELALRAYTATLRAELAQEVADITARITDVHEKALRELTAIHDRRR